MKIKEALNQKDISNSINKYILSNILKTDINGLLINQKKEISFLNNIKYKMYKRMIIKGKPYQYVLKKAHFYGRGYYINKNVLIPRPETERLIELTKEKLDKKFKSKNLNILDIGTGSGVIAITMKHLEKKYNIDATDISKKALKVARKNKRLQNIDINFNYADILNTNKKYDCIISNPPYIENNSTIIEKSVKENEPHLALFGGEKGLDVYNKIFKKIKNNLKENYLISLEIGENQSKELIKIVNKELNNPHIEIKKDYNNYERYLFITNK